MNPGFAYLYILMTFSKWEHPSSHICTHTLTITFHFVVYVVLQSSVCLFLGATRVVQSTLEITNFHDVKFSVIFAKMWWNLLLKVFTLATWAFNTHGTACETLLVGKNWIFVVGVDSLADFVLVTLVVCTYIVEEIVVFTMATCCDPTFLVFYCSLIACTFQSSYISEVQHASCMLRAAFFRQNRYVNFVNIT